MEPKPQFKREVAVDHTAGFGRASHDNAQSLAYEVQELIQNRYDEGYSLDGVIPDLGSDNSNYPYALLIFSRTQPTEIDDAYEVRPVTSPRKDKP